MDATLGIEDDNDGILGTMGTVLGIEDDNDGILGTMDATLGNLISSFFSIISPSESNSFPSLSTISPFSFS